MIPAVARSSQQPCDANCNSGEFRKLLPLLRDEGLVALAYQIQVPDCSGDFVLLADLEEGT